MIIFYKSQNKAKVYLNKCKRHTQEETVIVFLNCELLFEYIENQAQRAPNGKLFYCENKFCLLLENKKQSLKISQHIKAHLYEYGRLISQDPFGEISQAIKKVKDL